MIIPQIARAGKDWLKGGTVNVGKYSTSAPLGDNGTEKFCIFAYLYSRAKKHVLRV